MIACDARSSWTVKKEREREKMVETKVWKRFDWDWKETIEEAMGRDREEKDWRQAMK